MPLIVLGGSGLVIAYPDAFNHARMADMAIYRLFAVFSCPIEVLSILTGIDHLLIQLALLVILLLPLAIWVLWPLAMGSGLQTRSYVYIGLLIFYMVPGILLSQIQYSSITSANIFGVKYPEYRYLVFSQYGRVPTNSIEHIISITTIDHDLPDYVMSRFDISIENGGFALVEDKEGNPDWGLRKLLMAPNDGYENHFVYEHLRSRRPTQQYFFYRHNQTYGKGLIFGNNQIHLFELPAGVRVFASSVTSPTLWDRLKWYFSKDEPVYLK